MFADGQCVAWTGDGARLCLVVLYVDYHRPCFDFVGEPGPLESDCSVFGSGHRAVLSPIRRRMGWRMGIDLSPLVAIVAITFLQIAVVQSLKDLALRMN